MKRAKRTIVILGLALASCRAPDIAPVATPGVVDVRVLATTATLPLLEDFIIEYNPVELRLVGRSSATNWAGVQHQLRTGEARYALSTYVPVGQEWWVAPVGQDGIAIIVHPSNPVATLAPHDIRRLFTGAVTTWVELGGPDMPITVVVREPGADTRLALEAQVLGAGRIASNARLALSSQAVVDLVAQVPGAVGYVSMAYLTAGVRAVPIAASAQADGWLPTAATVANGAYALRTPIYIVGLNEPAPDSVYYDWFAWMQGPAGQEIVARHHSPLPVR